MNYNKGDIFSIKNIFFKDDGKIDTRLNGHPMILPIDLDFQDSYFYFFLITSQVHKVAREPGRFFPLSAKGSTRLPKASLVDLKYVYRFEKKTNQPRGYLPENVLSQVIKKYINYSDKHSDKESEELDNILQGAFHT